LGPRDPRQQYRGTVETCTVYQIKRSKASFGTIGPGSAPHVWALYFQQSIDGRLQFVPYRGVAPVTQDMIAGQIDLSTLEASNVLPHVRAGRIKGYAVLTESRWQVASEIPTIAEAGAGTRYMPFWYGLWGPKGTSEEAIAKLNAAALAALADPTTRARLIELEQEIPPPKQQTPQALAAYHKAECEKWWPITRAAGIEP
jgi:tripartite-type tricarboxylate transporter receptor subunit TctC